MSDQQLVPHTSGLGMSNIMQPMMFMSAMTQFNNQMRWRQWQEDQLFNAFTGNNSGSFFGGITQKKKGPSETDKLQSQVNKLQERLDKKEIAEKHEKEMAEKERKIREEYEGRIARIQANQSSNNGAGMTTGTGVVFRRRAQIDPIHQEIAMIEAEIARLRGDHRVVDATEIKLQQLRQELANLTAMTPPPPPTIDPKEQKIAYLKHQIAAKKAAMTSPTIDPKEHMIAQLEQELADLNSGISRSPTSHTSHTSGPVDLSGLMSSTPLDWRRINDNKTKAQRI
jgi:hypothetical protein